MPNIQTLQQVDEKAAAELLDLSPRKLQLMRQRGDGPRFVRVSARCIRYRLGDLEAWQESRLATNTLQEAG
jgi:hypothetical protein